MLSLPPSGWSGRVGPLSPCARLVPGVIDFQILHSSPCPRETVFCAVAQFIHSFRGPVETPMADMGVTRFGSSHSQRLHQGYSGGAACRQSPTENPYESSKQHAVHEDLRRNAKVEEHLAEVREVGRPG